MRAAHIVILAWVLIGDELQGQSPASGAVAPATVVQVPSPSLNEQRPATVLLPTSYSQSDRRYPVLYLLHGGGQDHTVFATRGWFGAQASRGIIIVTPNAGESWYINSVVDPKARYEDFIVKDLVSYIDSNYRTIATRQGRAIAGVSMGAWGAMLLGLKHHQLFGAVGALSAPYLISRQSPNMDMTSREQQTFGKPGSPERLERDPSALLAAIPVESVPVLYLASGNQDIFVIDNRRFVERLTERKIPYEYREVSPRGHSWDLWDDQLVNFMEMLFK
jgi:S-formylglutathione hydrolase FrmB